MTEKSLLWDGTTPGDAKAHAGDDIDNIFELAKGSGVIPGYLGELAVTGASSPVAVATGGAWVKGKPYWNTASVNVTVATPVTATRIDRIVLQSDWTAKTIRIARLAGSEGGAAPALTQTDGTKWEISLAQVSITTAGAITVTSERAWADRDMPFAMRVIKADSVDGNKNPVAGGITYLHWFLCDGSTFNGRATPNMADRLPIGVGTIAATQGATGGAATKDLSHVHAAGSIVAANESSHTHGAGTLANGNESTHTHAYGSIAVAAHASHNHSVSITSGAASTGTFDRAEITDGSGATYVSTPVHTHSVSGNTGSGGPTTHTVSGTSGAGAAHTHSISGSSAAGAAHTHSLSGNSGSAGAATQDVMNPYIGVQWFMHSPATT